MGRIIFIASIFLSGCNGFPHGEYHDHVSDMPLDDKIKGCTFDEGPAGRLFE